MLEGTTKWYQGDHRIKHQEGYEMAQSWLVFTPRRMVGPGFPYVIQRKSHQPPIGFEMSLPFQVIGSSGTPTPAPPTPTITSLSETIIQPDCSRCDLGDQCTVNAYCKERRFVIVDIQGTHDSHKLWLFHYSLDFPADGAPPPFPPTDGGTRYERYPIASDHPQIGIEIEFQIGVRVCVTAQRLDLAGPPSVPSQEACLVLEDWVPKYCPSANEGQANISKDNGCGVVGSARIPWSLFVLVLLSILIIRRRSI